ncbi:hypothetical protein BDF19DRAFT_434406 [Syncephalis fuscata]|nr:hypothetical protein BDF19DRAFT_434406 [Syncephalis fuscata]
MGAFFISTVLSIVTVTVWLDERYIDFSMYIMGITAYAINLAAAIFGFAITIWYILSIPKNLSNATMKKKKQAIILMCLYVILCLCIAGVFLGMVIFSSFGLAVFYLITLAPKNAMQGNDVPIEMDTAIHLAQYPHMVAHPGMVLITVYAPASQVPTTTVIYAAPSQPMPVPAPITTTTPDVVVARDDEL